MTPPASHGRQPVSLSITLKFPEPFANNFLSLEWVPPGHSTRYEATLALKGERIVGDTAYSRKDDHQHKENLKV